MKPQTEAQTAVDQALANLSEAQNGLDAAKAAQGGESKAQKAIDASSAAGGMMGERSVMGTFSADMAKYMGFGDVQQRIADALDNIETNTKDTADTVGELGVSYD
jgi:ABC-type microcin C transport system permease subunit YejB